MALKDWKRAKSRESISYPLVYRRKSDGDDTLVIKYYYRYAQYKYYDSFNKYEVYRNDRLRFKSKTKSEAIKFVKEYMKKY